LQDYAYEKTILPAMWIPASKTLAGWVVLGVGAVAAALYFSRPEERNVPGTVASSAAQATPPEAAPPRDSLADLLANARRSPLPRKVAGDPFAGHVSAPATQVQVAPIPAKPVAPPFPFKYAGWFQEGRSPSKVYLSRGDTVFPIKAGDVLEGFRIDAVQGERIEVTYLASGEQSSLLLASLTGAADGATFADASGTAGLPPQSAAVKGSSSGGATASAPGASQAAALAGGVARAPAAAAAAPMTSRSAGLVSQAISVAENAPPSGSMPTGPAPAPAMQPGPVPSGAFPAASAPSGKLGVEPAASGKLGSEAAPSGKLGL
jgi:hypothetical protein